MLNRALVFFAIFPLVLDMGGDIGLRWLSLLAISILFIKQKKLWDGETWYLFILLIIYPLCSYIIGLQRGGESNLGLSQFYACLFGFVAVYVFKRVPVIISLECYERSFLLLSTFVIALGLGLIFNNYFALSVASTLHETGGGYFGYKPNLGSYPIPNVYFKSTLFYCVPLIFYVVEKKLFYLIATLSASIFTASKVLVVFSVLCLFYTVWRIRKIYVFILISSLIVAASYIESSVDFIELLSSESGSYETRNGHWESLLNIWYEKPEEFLIGSGLGMSFFSVGVNDFVSNIEIDHVNTIRKYGVFWFIGFAGYVLFKVKKSISCGIPERRATGIATIAAFVLAGTNPVLLSPLFFVLLGMASVS